jgi:ATP-dependent DNA helicase RecG
MVLFGAPDRLMARFPQSQLRLARFRGTTKDEFLDNRQEIGNAFELFVRAQRFLRDHLPVAGRIVPGIYERVDDPLYPPEALREALANALCHRDYSIGGGAVTIAIFDDRLEIGSSGSLPFNQTVGSLLVPHPSRPWNPLIAQAFYRRGLIEQWGRGTLKMVSLTREAGLTAPEFESSDLEVIVRFRPLRYQAPTRVTVDLSPLQRDILEILSSVGSSSLREIQGLLVRDYPLRTVQDNLQSLRILGLVSLSGRTNRARWKLEDR